MSNNKIDSLPINLSRCHETMKSLDLENNRLRQEFVTGRLVHCLRRVYRISCSDFGALTPSPNPQQTTPGRRQADSAHQPQIGGKCHCESASGAGQADLSARDHGALERPRQRAARRCAGWGEGEESSETEYEKVVRVETNLTRLLCRQSSVTCAASTTALRRGFSTCQI